MKQTKPKDDKPRWRGEHSPGHLAVRYEQGVAHFYVIHKGVPRSLFMAEMPEHDSYHIAKLWNQNEDRGGDDNA